MSGFDRRTSPECIVSVLREMDADVMCLQEVVDAPTKATQFDQVDEIAHAFPGRTSCFGANRPLHGDSYGNLTLSRLPAVAWENNDITQKREPRGVMMTDLSLGAATIVYVFNVHLRTGFTERRYQAKRLTSRDMPEQSGLQGQRLVVGDFNEWAKGHTTRLLRDAFETFQPRHALRFKDISGYVALHYL